jgi:hypothetical protein
MSDNGRVVRVASGQGFWGDDLEAPVRQVEGGPIDYLMLDYLAEVTIDPARLRVGYGDGDIATESVGGAGLRVGRKG